MTRATPLMAAVSELVLNAVQVATRRVSEGSRRNARGALETRHRSTHESAEVLASLPAPRRSSGPAAHHTSG